ncbi:MAG: adenylate/guanylate cyclase domain-containing protein, partial [Acidimicrobiales bacterium]|nr:adenylate/guanylate cyclase domain-containing protein [Acidimicrobiales bacterium]
MRGADEVVRAFVFTDIEGSTRAWQADEEAMRRRLVAHDRIAREVVDGRSGTIFKHTGDGCIAVFADGADAVDAAVEMHGALVETGLRVRVGAHLGPAVERDGDWFGLTLNRCARIMAAAHGGQTLVSGAMAATIGPQAGELALHPLGRHLLRDIDEPEDLFQVEPVGSRTVFPPPRTVVPVVGLPVERSSFVGRLDDVARLAERVDAHRLVTVAGVGGTGKTRLAIRAAADAQVSFPGGAAFVDLTSVGDPDRLVGTIARAVGTPSADTAGAGDHDELATFIGYRRLLVVIDNAEHLVDDVAAVADLLLDRCPRLHLLVTSREPLGIEGEVVQRVAPLPTDDAVALFRERLAGEADDADEQRIAAICASLDGLPLAI